MAKIMQIINKKTSHKEGTVDIELLQTGFHSLTKVVGSVPGQSVANALSGSEVSHQFLKNLIDLQLALIPELNRFKITYNNAINTKKVKVPGLLNFSYSFNSLVNYKNLILEGMEADYRLLEMIVTPEKEAYDYTIYAEEHMKNNILIMSEWSKNRKYSDVINQIQTVSYYLTTNGEFSGGSLKSTNYPGATVWIEADGKFKYRFLIGGLDNIPTGKSLIFEYYVNSWYYDGDRNQTETAVVKITINKKSIGGTPDIGTFDETVRSYKNKTSSHFTDSTGKYDYKFFNSRVLI